MFAGRVGAIVMARRRRQGLPRKRRSEEELDRYTKNVSKRVNKLNQRAKEAENRALQAEQLLAQKYLNYIIFKSSLYRITDTFKNIVLSTF